jgi:hypothetical protein
MVSLKGWRERGAEKGGRGWQKKGLVNIFKHVPVCIYLYMYHAKTYICDHR